MRKNSIFFSCLFIITVNLWSQPNKLVEFKNLSKVLSFAFDQQEKYILIFYPQYAQFYSFPDFKEQKTIVVADNFKFNSCFSSANNEYSAINFRNAANYKTEIWSLSQATLVATTTHESNTIYNVTFSSNAQLIAFLYNNGSIKVFNIVTGETTHSFRIDSYRASKNDEISFLNNTTIIVHSLNHTIIVDLSDTDNFFVIDGSSTPLSINKNSEKIVISSGHSLKSQAEVFDIKNKIKVADLPSGGNIYMAEYSASGLYIITFARFSGELKVWDATTYEEIFKIQEQFSLDKYIIKLAFDDKQIVMANIDSSSVRVWDIKTAEEDVINDPFKLIIPYSADEDEKEIYKKIEKLIRGTNAQDGTPFKFSSNLKTCFITLNDNYLILKDSNNELYIFTRTLENVISKY